MRAIEWVLGLVADVVQIAAFLLLLALLQLLGFGVFLRFAIGATPSWMGDFQVFSTVGGFSTFFLLHLGAFFLILFLGWRIARARLISGVRELDYVLALAAAVIGGVLFWLSLDAGVTQGSRVMTAGSAWDTLYGYLFGGQETGQTSLPVAFLYFVLPVSALIIAVAGVRRLLRLARAAY